MVNPNPGGTPLQSSETKAAVIAADVVSAKTAVDTKATKAWLAGFGTLIVPLVLQNLLGTSDSAEVIFRYLFCHMLEILCPTGDDVYNAMKTLAGAIASAVGVGYLTYFIPNKAKVAVPENGGT